MYCWTSVSQTSTDCLGLANSYHHLRVFCLFIKARWPTVSSYLSCQHFNAHEYLECCTPISYLLYIYPRMKLAYCILLISLFRQTCQEKVVKTSVVSGSGRPETQVKIAAQIWRPGQSISVCRWEVLLKFEVGDEACLRFPAEWTFNCTYNYIL